MPNWKSLIPHRDNEEAPVPDEVWAPPARYSDEPSPKTTAELEHPEPAVGTVPIGNGATPAYDDEAPTEERTYDYSSDATGHVRDAADANVQGDDAEDGDPCPTCGHIVPPVRELLADTLSRVATRAPEVFATFYGSLFDERPDLAEMFPADLDDPGSDPSGGGHAQRERLLNASVAVASHYNPRNPESMAALNAALDKMGATHGESRMTVAGPRVAGWPPAAVAAGIRRGEQAPHRHATQVPGRLVDADAHGGVVDRADVRGGPDGRDADPRGAEARAVTDDGCGLLHRPDRAMVPNSWRLHLSGLAPA
jgi:hypothetical protein